MLRHVHQQVRLLVLLIRPPVLMLLLLAAVLGAAVGGDAHSRDTILACGLVVGGFLLTAVAVNDLHDEEVDRVNLQGDKRRPLVTGAATRKDMWTSALVGAAISLGGALLAHPLAVPVVLAGLALVAAYSLEPIRLARRGGLAALILPAGYVAVPYLTGLLSAQGTVHESDLLVLAGLYVGFIGRIVLKDFRDVKGDAMFGKRTFLVRHGRVVTCILSAGCWTLGSLVLLVVRDVTPVLVAGYLAQVVVVCWLLWHLARTSSHRVEERLITGIAILGRGLVLTLLVHYGVLQAGIPLVAQLLLVGAASTLAVGMAVDQVRNGPRSGAGVASERLERERVA